MALTTAAPIRVNYKEAESSRDRNIIVRYRQKLASAYTTITTELITVNENDYPSGIRLANVINLDLHRPEYYNTGYINNFSIVALFDFDDLQSAYDVLYDPTEYTTPVYYYTDDADPLNYIGGTAITYSVISFTSATTLIDLGLDLNLYQPAYCADGRLEYHGPINFSALRALAHIDIVYDTTVEPDDDDIIYPKRTLFLQHNDMGSYENQFPTWTMNHAYINTGVVVDDMSKLTVSCSTTIIDTDMPLYRVNSGYGYIFGSESAYGSYYVRYNNQTMYGNNLTGVDTYEAKAGLRTPDIIIAANSDMGDFRAGVSISANSAEGYSIFSMRHSKLLETEHARIVYPLYLFANNSFGSYKDGLAGVGITECKI